MTRLMTAQNLDYLYSPALDIAALAGIIVFVVFGVWSLHQRFRRLEEWPLRVQLVVLLLLLVFYIVEIGMLRLTLHDNIVFFIFALLGLFVAGLALYGHIVVSVLSRLLVELVAPDNPAASDMPRLGPAEALERQSDWDGALQEYYILARVYPGHALIYTRIANTLIRLERTDEAATWLERALKCSQKPEDCLALSRRLFDVHEALGDMEGARQALAQFLKRFPDHGSAKRIRKQLTSTGSAAAPGPASTPGGALESLDARGVPNDSAMNQREDAATAAAPAAREKAALTTLDSAPLELEEKPRPPSSASHRRQEAFFEALESAPLHDEDLDDTVVARREKDTKKDVLEAMEDEPPPAEQR